MTQSINDMKREHDGLTQRISDLQQESNTAIARRAALKNYDATPESLAEERNFTRIIDDSASQLPVLKNEQRRLFIKINQTSLDLDNLKVAVREFEAKLQPFAYFARMINDAEHKLNMVKNVRHQAQNELNDLNARIKELEGE